MPENGKKELLAYANLTIKKIKTVLELAESTRSYITEAIPIDPDLRRFSPEFLEKNRRLKKRYRFLKEKTDEYKKKHPIMEETKDLDLDGSRIIVEEKKIDGKTVRILKFERPGLEQKKIKCENCGHIHDLGHLNELISKRNQFENEAKLAIRAGNYGKGSRKYHQASKIAFEVVDMTKKADCICKRCNRFSANLYIDLKGVNYRLKYVKKIFREDKGNRLQYLGIVFDSTFQVYPISGRDQNKLDYISGRYLYENSDFYKNKKTKKTFLSENVTGRDLILYKERETFSFDYNKLTFIFTGGFTTEIKKWLIEETTRFIERLFSLDIIKYENLCSDISSEAEFEKLTSYILILEDFFLFSFTSKCFEIDQMIDNFFQKVTF